MDVEGTFDQWGSTIYLSLAYLAGLEAFRADVGGFGVPARGAEPHLMDVGAPGFWGFVVRVAYVVAH